MYNYIFLALIISFLWGIQPVFYKHLLKKFDRITIMLFSSIIYFLCVTIFSIINKKKILSDIHKFTFNDIFILVGVSIFTIFVTNMIYYYILKNHKSSIISALIYSSPIFTLIISYLYLNERLDKNGFLGIISIIIGVILISQNNKN